MITDTPVLDDRIATFYTPRMYEHFTTRLFAGLDTRYGWINQRLCCNEHYAARFQGTTISRSTKNKLESRNQRKTHRTWDSPEKKKHCPQLLTAKNGVQSVNQCLHLDAE